VGPRRFRSLPHTLDKVKLRIRYMPYNFLAWYQFSDLLGAAVKVFVVELKLCTEFVGTTVNFF